MANAVAKGNLICVGFAGVLCALAVQAAGESYVVSGSKAAQEESCVEDTDFMRRNHMEVIKHQRDEAVHNGIRSSKHTLAGCIECHVSYKGGAAPLPVNGEGQFCSACHEFAAVGLNCFDCHATIPAYTYAEAAAKAARGGVDPHSPTAEPGPATSGQRPEVSGEGN